MRGATDSKSNVANTFLCEDTPRESLDLSDLLSILALRVLDQGKEVEKVQTD